MIRVELQNNRRIPEQVIEKHRKNRLDLGMLPKEFARALKQEVPGLIDKLTNSKLSILVNYLVQEELGMVSYDKLFRALNLHDRDPPLRQDHLETIRSFGLLIKDQLDKARMPLVIMHFMQFLDTNELKIHEMFNIPTAI